MTQCIHGKEIYERCLTCEEGLKRGEHGGFVRAEQRPSKELCKHLEPLPVGIHNLTLSAGPFVCPWCEIERLNADMAWIRRRTGFWGEVPASQVYGDTTGTYAEPMRAAQPPGDGQ